MEEDDEREGQWEKEGEVKGNGEGVGEGEVGRGFRRGLDGVWGG